MDLYETALTPLSDVSLRGKAGEVMPELVAGCDVILGNEEDAEKVFGIHPEGVDITSGHVEGAAYESVARQLMARFPRCRKVVITLRGSLSASHNTWSGVLWDGQRLYQGPAYQITHIVDRVGGGDSFMGGLIYRLLTYPEDDQKALDFAVAASALKHTIYGDANLVTAPVSGFIFARPALSAGAARSSTIARTPLSPRSSTG